MALVGMLASGASEAQGFAKFPLPPYSNPQGITAGPDGNIWFTEYYGKKVGRITTAGLITEFPVTSGPLGITVGPDGALWFTEDQAVGRITTDGAITEFPIRVESCCFLSNIAAGSDGNLWFTSLWPNSIFRISPAGAVTQFLIPTWISQPYGPATSGTYSIAAGQDGNLWFAESGGNKIGRITTSGVITEFPLPSPSSSPNYIAAGPDGALWFTEGLARIGRISTTGAITEFPTPSSGGPITLGPDGAMWFVGGEGGQAKLDRITTGGAVTEFSLEVGGQITAGPDGNLWLTEFTLTTDAILRVSTTPGRVCLTQNRFCAEVAWSSQAEGGGFGIASAITSNTAAFWFFSSDNIDLVVKVLDGRSVDGHFWVFYGSLTNVEFTLTITDTQTGAVKTYFNPQGQLASVADTSAF